ncbi:MAG: autotransporter-associated beta strand repeat-containing protein [Verrucomicrobiaceae bacterium]|nr:autotransporter-associated beta strand repeat-containing protein [Verrucomicrobiaceae bacterium]
MLRFLALVLLGTASLLAQSGSGTGLTGQYYDTATFTTLKTTRTDATVNFNFSTMIPSGTAITAATSYSVAWSGQIEPEFSGLYTFYVTADDGARLWVNDQMIASRTFFTTPTEMRGQVTLEAGKRVNIRLEFIQQSGGASVKLEWSSASRAREVIPTSRLYPARVDKVGGSVLKEHWSGITGGAISSITSNANYPGKPGGREFITSFECLAQDWADSYGTRVTGFIVPPVTGSYTFAVSGDEVVELYVSTDATSANKSLAASVSSATAFRAWGTPSTARTLTQGVRYYVELLHKENTGTDHWSVGWKKPGDSVFSVIPGSALAQPGTTTTQPTEANLLNTMAQEHPRLFATAERFAKLKAAYLSPTASQAKTWATSTISSANTILTQAPVVYAPDVRSTILSESRTVKDRMYKLALAWWMTGDAQYAERAWTELNTVADNTLFPNWNPSHFLDVAEMTHACAIGYDWFYHYWDTARRTTIRNAIINKGLNPGLSQFTSNVGWSQGDGNNWNQVCTGGLTMGALALGTESEALVENILNRSINSTRPCWKHFTTDNGAWYEGPGYWGYTTEYGIRMLAALEWVLGSDFGLSNTQNVSESGFAPILSLGTSNVIFNYADSGAGGASRGPVFQWLARRYGQPVYDWWNNQGSGGALDALWWNESSTTPASSAQQPDMAFHGEEGTAFESQEMVTMRGKWNDSRATFVGVKAGQMGADHGNLDAGTFVLDALGTRWFHDLGSDNYALPNYFSGTSNASGVDRWDYYRMRPEGQNTLAINPDGTAGMVLNAVAPLIAYQTEPGGSGSFAIHDLTPVYSGMSKVWRGTRLMGARNQVLVQDEIQSATGKTVWWFAHYTYPATSVVIDPDGTSAMMTRGVERLWCKIVSGGGTFQIMDAVPLPGSANPVTSPAQNANTGHKKLAINLTNVTNTTLAVWFVPLQTADPIPTTLPTITALNTWNISATNDAPVAVNGVATSNGENPVDIDLRNYITDDSTPSAQMLFTVANAVNGTVTLLADGFTARFTPTPGYTGVPSFTFTATDAGGNADTMLVWDFDLPDGTATNVAVDASGKGRDGTIDFASTGTYSLATDKPAALAQQGARSIDVVENTTTGARVQRVITATELDWNVANWTVAGWFKRRDTTNDDMVWHISDGDGFGSNDELYLNCPAGATTVRLQHFNAVGAAFDVDIAQTSIAAGTWYHFAVVRNGTSLSLYINGTLVGTDSAFTLALNQTNPLVFGGHASTTAAPQRWFDGGLDDLMLSKAVLDATQIASLANGMTARHFGGLSTTATISLSAAPVNYVWTSTTSGNWSTGTNWQSGASPTGTRGASVQFFTGQTLTGVTATATNDIAGVFQMNNLTLAGTASGVSTATISGGTFQLLNNGTTLPTVNLAGVGGSSPNVLTYNINTPLVLGADTTFNGTNSGIFIFNGDVTGSGGITRTGTFSKLVLAGTNSYTGDTTISAGTLQIGNDGATGSLGTGDVINNGTLRFDRTGTLTVPNAITGTGGVQIDCLINAGTVVFSGTNTFDGGVNVSGGTLRITNSTALGDGTKTVSLSNGTSGAPHLNLDGSSDPIELPATISYNTSSATGAIINEAGDNTIFGPINLTGGGGDTKILTNAGTLTLSGPIAPIATGRNLLLDGPGTGIVTSVISNGSGVNSLSSVNKQGASIWTLAGNNSHSGTTTVSAGTLKLGHPNALGSGGWQFGNTAGATSITSGATVDLNGQQGINEAITVRGTGIGSGGALVNNSTTAASIAAGMVASISTTAGGVHSTVPDVILSGNATAVATLGLSAASFTIAGGTTQYSAAPTVTISGGGGTGATATAVLTSGVVTGITITNAGTGYTSAPTIAFSGGTITTAGTNPTGTGNATNFVVAGIQVTNPGSGYTSAPSVTFSSGTGTAATANLSAFILGAASSIGGAGDLIINPGITGGSNTLTKVGAGTVTLTGANTYTGATTVSAGTLIIADTHVSNVTVGNGGVLIHPGSTTVNVTVQSGGLDAPGTTTSLRTIGGNFSLNAGGTLRVRLNGSTAGTQFDQLVVSGTVTLGGALDVVCGPNLAPGSTFRILDKAGTTTTATTFTGKAENSTFVNADGYTFRINYNSGTGNDIVLTLITTPIEQWRFANYGSVLDSGNGLDTADIDGDGVSNLMEYATKMNTAASDVVPQSAAKNGSVIDFVYTKNKSATDVTFIVEWSDTLLSDWSIAGVSAPTILSDNGVTQQIKVTVPAGTGVTKRFVHLRVTRP